MTTWACTQTFVLTSGALNRAAESHLTKQGVRRLVGWSGVAVEGYVCASTVEADELDDALNAAGDQLAKLLDPYPVTYEVIESEASRA